MASLVKIFSPSKCKTQDNFLKTTRMPGHTTTNYIYLKYELWKHLIQGMPSLDIPGHLHLQHHMESHPKAYIMQKASYTPQIFS